MHFKTAFGKPSCKLCLYGCGFSFCPTMYQPVIRIPAPREVWVLSCHPCIKRVVQEKIREYRTDNAALRSAFGPLDPRAILHFHRRCQPSFDVLHLHFTCLRTARNNSVWSMLSKRPRISNSSTKSYCQHRLRVTPMASMADLLGR